VVALPDEVRALLDAPNYVHLATLQRDGAPQSVAVWVGLESGRILVGTGRQTGKAKNTRRDPQVALSVVDRENPYRQAMIRGRVIEQRPDPECAIMNEISQKYTGEPVH
jgi:PPOX class probable F420-dependent enzyme